MRYDYSWSGITARVSFADDSRDSCAEHIRAATESPLSAKYHGSLVSGFAQATMGMEW